MLALTTKSLSPWISVLVVIVILGIYFTPSHLESRQPPSVASQEDKPPSVTNLTEQPPHPTRVISQAGQPLGVDSQAGQPLGVDSQAGQPLFVLILSYQRTASSVISHILGDLPGQFFMYEPLDMALSAMYGSLPKWNIPSNIFSTPEAKPRSLHPDEQRAMTWTLDTIYQCNMSASWPMFFLVNADSWFWELSSSISMNYTQCVIDKHQDVIHFYKTQKERCIHHLETVCPMRYSNANPQSLKCKSFLWQDGHFAKHMPDMSKWDKTNVSAADIQHFQDFFQCLNWYEEDVRACAYEYLDLPCQRARIRVIKTVRGPMSLPGYFFQKYPNFRLVHLFRDPRGNVNSRQELSWSKGEFESRTSSVADMAKIYCQFVLSDYQIHQKLRDEYPGRSLQIISDEFMVNPLKYVKQMTTLLNINETEVAAIMGALVEKGIFSQRQTIQDNNEILNRMDEEEAEDISNTYSNNDTKPLSPGQPLAGQTESQNVVEKTSLTGEVRLQYWQRELGPEALTTIQTACKDFYKQIAYDW